MNMHIKIEGVLTSFNDKAETERLYGSAYTPEMLAESLKAVKGNSLHITLSTDGGCVESSFKMYDMLVKSGKRITITAYKAHSAGTIILLAGHEREVINGSQALVHLPWSTLNMDVNSKILGELYDIYRQEDLRLFDFYNRVLKLSAKQREDLWSLYENETILNAEQMLKFGFATRKTEGKGVVITNSAIKALAFTPVILNMVKQKQNKKETMATLKEKLKDILNSFKIKNASISVDGRELHFEGETVAVGTILFEDADMTVQVAPSEFIYEGRKYQVGEGGEVMAIEETTEDEERFDEEMQAQILDVVKALKKDNEELRAEICALKAKTVGDKGSFKNHKTESTGNSFLDRKAKEREFRREIKNQLNNG